VAVPLPLDWPDGGGSSEWFRAESRVLREVAARIRTIAAAGRPEPTGSLWTGSGVVRALDPEPGRWATGRSVQYLHAQLREAVTAFHGALVAGLPAVAARLENSAAEYDQADRANAQEIDRTAAGLDGGSPSSAPSVVGPDGRF
jgi:hypothetical protein